MRGERHFIYCFSYIKTLLYVNRLSRRSKISLVITKTSLRCSYVIKPFGKLIYPTNDSFPSDTLKPSFLNKVNVMLCYFKSGDCHQSVSVAKRYHQQRCFPSRTCLLSLDLPEDTFLKENIVVDGIVLLC